MIRCRNCDLEVEEREIEANDGCCPECGAPIYASGMLDEDSEEELDDEESEEGENGDEDDFFGNDEENDEEDSENDEEDEDFEPRPHRRRGRPRK